VVASESCACRRVLCHDVLCCTGNLAIDSIVLLYTICFHDRPIANHRRKTVLFLRFRRPFVKRFALCYQTVVCLSVCMSILSVCDVGVLWPNGWMDQDATWYGDRPRPWRLCVRWGPSPPPPIFGPHLLWPNGWMNEDATWY